MTVNLSSPRARPRWLTLAFIVLGMSAIGVGLAAGHGVATLPAGYLGSTLEDVHGANDVPGQVDVTQMGRDNTQAPKLRIFWAWDSIDVWTGSGQTGDACALFDTTDADLFINYVVCARVQNLNANPDNVVILPAAADKPVYIFDCSNKKVDRCTNPAPRPYTAGQVLAGPLGSLSQAGTGNLISDTDPFDAGDLNGPGTSYPHDSTIDIEIAAALVPANVGLANVCSYPSAGNGGNNNPFDCIVTPGTQYGTLRVVKSLTNDSGGTLDKDDFSYTVNGGSALNFEADGTNDAIVPVGNYTVAETAAVGYTTSYGNSVNGSANCNSLAVTVGAITTCTISNNDDQATITVVKVVDNDNGGAAAPDDFDLTLEGEAVDSGVAVPVDPGTYTADETLLAGYSFDGFSGDCDENGDITVALGESKTCTLTNSDNQATITVTKVVNNDNGLSAEPDDFNLTLEGSDVLSGIAVSVDPGTYTAGETLLDSYSFDGFSGDCDENGDITVALGESKTCTLTNSDEPATPEIATDVDAQIRDNVTITGRGTPSGTVDFRLYTDSACEELFGEELGVALVDGSATSTWFDISASGTYFWQVQYSGDQNNEARTGDCDEEIDITSDHFDPVGGAAALGFALPILAWALWSRRRREDTN